MKIYHSIRDFKPVRNAVVTIGTFDGVHVGHQKIIARLLEIAAETNGEVVLLTFFPHPRMVLFPDDNDLVLLNTLDEKIMLLRHYGVQHLLVHPFSMEFSRTSSTEFVRDILVNKIGTKKLVIGYDHHFGRNREGSFNDLLELSSLYDYEVEKIPEQDINEVAVSSTKIRKSLLSGDIKTATSFLGHEYSLAGKVVKGQQLGRTMGFPTANLEVPEKYKLIPGNGVYAVTVDLNGSPMKGVLSIGNRPTFDNGERSIEVHIFNFDMDIYGQNLRIYFREFLRPDLKFDSAEALRMQMLQDKDEAIKQLS
jgi:riboflavin kinase / FMN adenylyltransferase